MHFKSNDRLQFALDRVRQAHGNPEQLSLAQAFERRVQSYLQCLREDLQADSVAAPTDASGPWLLYKASASSVLAPNGFVKSMPACAKAALSPLRENPSPSFPKPAIGT